MSVRTALLVLMVMMVVQAAVALPAGVIIEGRRGLCDESKCMKTCKDRYEQNPFVRSMCYQNECICWPDPVFGSKTIKKVDDFY